MKYILLQFEKLVEKKKKTFFVSLVDVSWFEDESKKKTKMGTLDGKTHILNEPVEDIKNTILSSIRSLSQPPAQAQTECQVVMDQNIQNQIPTGIAEVKAQLEKQKATMEALQEQGLNVQTKRPIFISAKKKKLVKKNRKGKAKKR